MKALESEATVGPDGKLTLPDRFSEVLPRGVRMRVILLIDDPAEQDGEAWSHAAAARFLADDDDADSVYDRP